MAICRVEKNKNYTTVANYCLRDKKLSLKAKGLLCLVLSLPESWDYSIRGLVSLVKEEERAVKSTLTELKERGYLKIIKTAPHPGQNVFTYAYIFYEQPQNEGVQSVGLQVVPVQDIPLYKYKEGLSKEYINDTSKPETAPACGAPLLEKETETAPATAPAVKGKDGFLYVKPAKDDDPEQLAEWNKAVDKEPVLFGKQFSKADLRGFAKEPAKTEPQRKETATNSQGGQNEHKNAPRAKNKEKSESGAKKERKPTRLFEFAQWVAKVFDYEIEEGAQFQLWFKRNCRTLKFILEYSGDNFQRGLMMIKACHDSLDAQNLTFSYESVTRRAPEWYSQAKQWYESGRRMGVTDSGEFKLI